LIALTLIGKIQKGNRLVNRPKKSPAENVVRRASNENSWFGIFFGAIWKSSKVQLRSLQVWL